MCFQTLVAVIQAIMQEQRAIAEDENEIVNQRSRDCEVRISTFVEQRLPLGFLGLECLQMGSMTIAQLH
jgi:hypothetical protein